MDNLPSFFGFLVENAPALTGLALPPLVHFINRDVKHGQEKFIVTVMACLLAAVVLRWEELMVGSIDEFLTSASIIFLQSQVVFRLYFKESYYAQRIEGGFVPVNIPDKTAETENSQSV